MKQSSKAGKIIASFLLCSTLAGNISLFSQDQDEGLEETASPQVSIASPLFLSIGAVFSITGTLLWLNGSSDDTVSITGASLLGTGLVAVIVGFIIGGSDDVIKYDQQAAINTGKEHQLQTLPGASQKPEENKTPEAKS